MSAADWNAILSRKIHENRWLFAMVLTWPGFAIGRKRKQSGCLVAGTCDGGAKRLPKRGWRLIGDPLGRYDALSLKLAWKAWAALVADS
jgi:hypothetical protein